MPPKKTANTADSNQPALSDTTEEKAPVKEKPAVKVSRKLPTHPSTALMVKEALKALDSRKGVSNQAIQSYIKEKHPSVDVGRMKYLVRRTLKKGLENGTLVRPVNAAVTTGATGRFRLAPKNRGAKPKSENTNPNVEEASKTKGEAKQPQKAGASKKIVTSVGPMKSTEDSKPPKKSPKEKAPVASKAAPAKKPKAKQSEVKGSGGTKSDSAKTKATKAGKATQNQATKSRNDAPSKAAGK